MAQGEWAEGIRRTVRGTLDRHRHRYATQVRDTENGQAGDLGKKPTTTSQTHSAAHAACRADFSRTLERCIAFLQPGPARAHDGGMTVPAPRTHAATVVDPNEGAIGVRQLVCPK